LFLLDVMRRRICIGIAVCAAMPLLTCIAKDQKKAPSDRDGSSFEKAIIVPRNQPDEVNWEFKQMRRLHPDADIVPVEQALASHGGRDYDLWVLKTPHGKVTVYFDITEHD